MRETRAGTQTGQKPGGETDTEAMESCSYWLGHFLVDLHKSDHFGPVNSGLS